METEKIRWGILGTSDIARKNWLGILNSGNGVISAVASRDAARAKNFIEECQAVAPMPARPRAFGSYQEMLNGDTVEAVYIPLPTGLRKEWVLRAAECGKHVVCEKPCAPSLSDLREMLGACTRNLVQFLDGVMFMHSARLPQVRKALEGLGELRRITSAFTFRAPADFFKANIRSDPHLEPHGCLGDLGWYCVRFSLWAMNWRMPKQVSARILARHKLPGTAGNVLTELSGELLFENDVSAGFFCSFLAHNQEWALLSGTEGYARIEDFVLPFAGERIGFEVSAHEFIKTGCDFRMQPQVSRMEVAEHSHGDASAQESNLFRAFADQIRSENLNESWADFALKTQAVVEACRSAALQERTLNRMTDGLSFA